MYISNIYRGAWAWGTPVSTPWSAPSLYVILDCFFIILIQYNIRMFFCGGLRSQQICIFYSRNAFARVFEISRP